MGNNRDRNESTHDPGGTQPLLPGVTSRKGQGPSFPPAGAVLFSKRLHPAIRTWIDGGCVLLKPLPLLTASLAPRWRGRSSNEGGTNEMRLRQRYAVNEPRRASHELTARILHVTARHFMLRPACKRQQAQARTDSESF
jgi:hypothetical protein